MRTAARTGRLWTRSASGRARSIRGRRRRWTRFGRGCSQPTAPGDFASFYEYFSDAAAFDLGNTSLTMTPNGSGHVVTAGSVPYLPPSAAATVLPLAVVPIATVTLASPFPMASGAVTQLEVCARGFVSAAPGNVPPSPPLPAPSPGNMLSAPATAWYLWNSFDPSQPGSGQIKFEELGSLSVITWDGVRGGPFTVLPSTFQFQFDRASGAVHYVFGSVNMSSIYSGPALVGYSPGGPSGDPGSRDLSAVGTFTVRNADLAPLDYATSGRPRLGTSISLLTSAMPAGSVLGADALSFTRFSPGLDLASIGMPGCLRHVGLDVTLVFLPASGTGSLPLPIPANTAFAGIDVFSQSFAFAPGANAVGATTSNGMRLHIDVN